MTVLLDTNILQYLASEKSLGGAMDQYIKELRQRHYALTISDITIAELVSGLPKQRMDHVLSTVETFRQLEVNKAALYISGRLLSLYASEGIPVTQITLADRIIAATVILTESFLLTANFHDFPWPFFREVEEKLVFYRYKNRPRMIPISLLQPNLPVIKQRYDL